MTVPTALVLDESQATDVLNALVESWMHAQRMLAEAPQAAFYAGVQNGIAQAIGAMSGIPTVTVLRLLRELARETWTA